MVVGPDNKAVPIAAVQTAGSPTCNGLRDRDVRA